MNKSSLKLAMSFLGRKSARARKARLGKEGMSAAMRKLSRKAVAKRRKPVDN